MPRIPLSGREPRAHGDVGLVGSHEREEPGELVDGMLAVGVDPAHELVAVLVGIRVPGCDAFAKAAVLAEREDVGARVARHDGGSVRRAVVDDEYLTSGKCRAQLVQHGREVVLLVPGGDEDQRVGRRHPGDVR